MKDFMLGLLTALVLLASQACAKHPAPEEHQTSAKAPSGMETAIEQIQEQITHLRKNLDAWSSTNGEQMEQLRQDINADLDRLSKTIDKAFSSDKNTQDKGASSSTRPATE